MLIRSWLKIKIFCGIIAQCVGELEKKVKRLAHQYPTDLNDENIAEEMQRLSVVHKANYLKPDLKPFELINL